MKTQFLCPQCRATLRVRQNIIFKVRTEDQKMGILLVNPELGNYSYISSPDLKFEDGEKIDFMCPVCCDNLVAKDISEDLVQVIMIDNDDREYRVYFSSIAGEHSTFKIEEQNIVEHYGEDSSAYLNYFMKKLKLQLEKT
jgi:transcription initiation factor IIE alpha subunit